jgi:hypothetical protein
MIPTGKFNPITGEEILKVESKDITFWEKEWDDLTLDEQAMFCSYIGAKFYSKNEEYGNYDIIKRLYNYNRFTNPTNPQLHVYGDTKNTYNPNKNENID